MKRLSEDERESIRKRNLIGIGQYITKKRNKDGATQEELAEQLDVNRTTLSHYENGTRDMPLSNLFLIGESLDFNLKDYVLEVEPQRAVELYEKAIYREAGQEKGFYIGYTTATSRKLRIEWNISKDYIEKSLQVYFETEESNSAKRMLILADMLYREMSDKSAMNTTYKSIVSEIANTGNRRIDAVFREYISIVRNERNNPEYNGL